jgi:hypothetical protein
MKYAQKLKECIINFDNRTMTIPYYILRDLLRDRLSTNEINRIYRLSEPNHSSDLNAVTLNFKDKTAVIPFKLDEYLEPTWRILN